jgi:uncharacterized membrane protein
MQLFNTRLKRYILENSARASRVLGILGVVIALTTLVSLFYYHGYHLTEKQENLIFILTIGSLSFFIFKYLFLWFYAENKKQYLRKHLVEGIFLCGFIINFFILFWWNRRQTTYDYGSFQNYYILFLQLYF